MMDWTLIIVVALISVAAVRFAMVIADAPRIKRESACEHKFEKVPVWSLDDAGKTIGDVPAGIHFFCGKCGCKRKA